MSGMTQSLLGHDNSKGVTESKMLQMLVNFHTNKHRHQFVAIFHYLLPLDFSFKFVPIMCIVYAWYMAKRSHPP